MTKTLSFCLLLTLLLAACGPAIGAQRTAKAPVDHVIVIYMENRSFDSIFGSFPGAEGLSQGDATATQADAAGRALDQLPPVADNPNRLACPAGTTAAACPSPKTFPALIDTGLKPLPVDSRFPQLPNQPFDIGQFAPTTEQTGNPVHRFYQAQMQIDDGRMDRFAAVSDAGGLVMGHYDGSSLEMWKYAQQFTLADHFFMGAFGGSFLNHFWLVCACTPRFDGAAASLLAQVNPDGSLVKDGAVTPDGFGVNTLYSVNSPHPDSTKPEEMMPQQTMAHIGDRLDAQNVSWSWYSGGWNDALAGKPGKDFQFHHQPLAYFKDLADGTDARAKHLKDESDFLSDLKSGNLPAVAFVKPYGTDNEHPQTSTLAKGDAHAAQLVKAVQDSPYWKTGAVIVTNDDNGGMWDHVAPPRRDRWGPGVRVPAVVISPYAKKGFVDKTTYDTTSILRFIEWRWDLQPLGERDTKANNLLNAFQF